MSRIPELNLYIYYQTYPNPNIKEHSCSDQPCKGHITYDRTMPHERAAKQRVAELQEMPHIESAWFQCEVHPEAFY